MTTTPAPVTTVAPPASDPADPEPAAAPTTEAPADPVTPTTVVAG